MNQGAGNDMYVTGGSITTSEYEQNMTPQDQQKYETLLMDEFMMSYNRDPYKRNLDFKHWLRILKPELYRERALKYDDIKAQNNGIQKLREMDPQEAALLEDAGMLQSLAHLHTGRIEDIAEIVSTMEPSMSPMESPQFREPPGYVAPQVPQTVEEGGVDPIDTSSQGLFDYEGTNKELFQELGQEYKD